MPEHVFTYTYEEFAAELRISTRFVKDLVKRGDVKSVLISRKCRRLESPAAYQARKLGAAP
jgi:hypothetical protein